MLAMELGALRIPCIPWRHAWDLSRPTLPHRLSGKAGKGSAPVAPAEGQSFWCFLGLTAIGWKTRAKQPASLKRVSLGDGDSPVEEDSFQLMEDDTNRLDVLLSERYSQSRSYFEALIQQGAVSVNGQRRKKSFRKFHSGDIIDVRFLVDLRTLPLEPEAMDLEVLYEDDELLVINKPNGLVVHPAPGNWTGTLVNGVLHYLGFSSMKEEFPSGERPGIVHRLDVGTTGVIVVAKTALAYSLLSQAFAEREVQKTYLAVVLGGRKCFFGHPKGSGHLVDKAIGRSESDRRLMTTMDQGGRPAVSLIRALATDVQRKMLLVEVRPRTGRTHQIRVHLAEEHSPILGDTAYGWQHMNRRYASVATRPMLHAYKLSLKHPTSADENHVTFVAKLPDDMRQLILRMQPEEGEEAFLEELLRA